MSYDLAPNVEVTDLKDGTWFAAFAESHRGAWGEGDSPEEAMDDLVDVLPDWHWLSNQFGGPTDCTCVMTFTGSL